MFALLLEEQLELKVLKIINFEVKCWLVVLNIFSEEIICKAPADAFAEAMNIDTRVSSRKIQNQLGWKPRAGSLLMNADIWFKAWKAWQSTKKTTLPVVSQ